MGQKVDVVIIGAGIIGLSIAFQVARRSSLRVLVLEKAAAVGEGSTGASSAVCRHRYSAEQMVQFAAGGINAYRHWQAYTGLENPRAEFQRHGVLWMPGDDTAWAGREHQRMRELGIATAVLDDSELAARYPAFSNCRLAADVETGSPHSCSGGGQHLLELDGGYIDPMAAAEDLVEACRLKNVEVRFNAAVDDVLTRGGEVSGVKLASGEIIDCPRVVNAMGPWCNILSTRLGLSLPWNLVPTRIQILYIDRPEILAGDIPATVDMKNGIYFRLQNRGQQLVIGSVLEQDEQEVVSNPDDFNRFADDDFQLRTLHALHHRLPALPYRGGRAGYCGLYTMNRDDVHPIIGETAVSGYFLVNGFSGHGFKLAPAVGAMVAKMLTGNSSDFDTEVDPVFFALDRKLINPDSKSVLA
ncbi:MAG: FAD-dependent oxidoreductase [Halioglobus sp.]